MSGRSQGREATLATVRLDAAVRVLCVQWPEPAIGQHEKESRQRDDRYLEWYSPDRFLERSAFRRTSRPYLARGRWRTRPSVQTREPRRNGIEDKKPLPLKQLIDRGNAFRDTPCTGP